MRHISFSVCYFSVCHFSVCYLILLTALSKRAGNVSVPAPDDREFSFYVTGSYPIKLLYLSCHAALTSW